MSRAPVEWRVEERAETMNTCLCCGMPFHSIGRDGKWPRVLAAFEDVYARRCPRGGGCFDLLQDAHLMHRLQRDEGAACMDDDFFRPEWPDGEHGDGAPGLRKKKKAPVQAGEEDDEDEDDNGEEPVANRTRSRRQAAGGQGGAPGGQGGAPGGQGGAPDGQGGAPAAGVVNAVPNSSDAYDRMRVIELEDLLAPLGTLMKEDADRGVSSKFQRFVRPEEHDEYWPEIYAVTFPACVRCNTLMTMIRRNTDLLVALRAIEPGWFDAANRPRSNAVRRYRYGLLIRKSVKKAQNVLRAAEVPVDHDQADAHMDPVQDAALVQLVQTVFLAMSALTALAGKGEDEADHFRCAGICRVYISAVMWVLCRIRWSSGFRTPFVQWHVHYAENMPLAQRRSFLQWFFGDHDPVPLAPGAPISGTGVYELLQRCLIPALFVATHDDPNAQRQRFEMNPSVWQLMYVCTPDVRPTTFNGHTLSRQLEARDIKFLPVRGYAPWARSKGRANSQRLDVGVWVDAFGPRVALRRMVACAVFYMPEACAALLLHAIENNGEVPDWATSDDPAPPADFDLLGEYEAFMIKHYKEVNRLCRTQLRGRRAPDGAGPGEDADFDGCGDEMRAATAFDRVNAGLDMIRQ
jgi:hypothetical protein